MHQVFSCRSTVRDFLSSLLSNNQVVLYVSITTMALPVYLLNEYAKSFGSVWEWFFPDKKIRVSFDP